MSIAVVLAAMALYLGAARLTEIVNALQDRPEGPTAEFGPSPAPAPQRP